MRDVPPLVGLKLTLAGDFHCDRAGRVVAIFDHHQTERRIEAQAWIDDRRMRRHRLRRAR